MIFDPAASNSMGKRLSFDQRTFQTSLYFSSDIATFFEPAIKNIIKVIEEQSRKTTKKIKVSFREL